ncbi:MAG: hypothetical protein WCR60_03855 [Patescibacteria group bacterium]|jgi:hypothetical protein
MQKAIIFEEYQQAFNQLICLPIIDVFKAAGTELFFVIKNKSNEKLSLVVDGVWHYENEDYQFLSDFKDDGETALELYERIGEFVEQKLKNKVKSISEFKFDEKAKRVSIIFNDQSVINVLANEFGLISVSNYQKKEAVLAKKQDNGQIAFFSEVD